MHKHPQTQQQQTQQKHNEHWQMNTTATATTCTAEYSLPFNQQEQQPPLPPPQHYRHQHMPRKHSHSHSPHPSRHTSPHSRHTSPHSRHTSPHSRHTSPHSRHTSPHSRHTSPHSRHTSPHSRHTSPHAHSHSHGHGHTHSSPHQSYHHVHDQHQNGTDNNVQPFVRNSAPRASIRSTSSHIHSHHTHAHHFRRRSKRNENQHVHHHAIGVRTEDELAEGQERHQNGHLTGAQSSVHTCARRHRSVTDVSQTSLNTCNDPLCTEREIQEIFVQKSTACCSSSRTELAQYFAEDLYGTSSRRPSSCCTSSDYCYQTDSTSLYGSRSSLSRNNSVKSASVTMRKKKIQPRQPSYSSISLRALNSSRPNSQMGSLTSVFDRAKKYAANSGSNKAPSSPTKVTIERHTSKDAFSNDLPEYACSPSPIRWSFLADGKTSTNENSLEELAQQQHTSVSRCGGEERQQHRPDPRPQKRERNRSEHTEKQQPVKPQRSHSRQQWKTRSSSDDRPSTSRKCCESPCKYEESTMVQFHQDAEAYNNCCSNYIQCNTYLDQDLQITSEDIHQYLSKGQQDKGNILNNTKTYPFQPSNALEFQYKNNFANNNTATNTLSSVEGTESMRSYDSRFKRNSSKETNLNQNPNASESCGGACAMSSCSSTPLSPANINLSSSTNNINIVFSTCMERNANEVKFINTTSRQAVVGATAAAAVVSTESHHAGYLPYTYPSYDYTNMAVNSQFNKPLGIDTIPTEMMARGEDMMANTNTSSSQHSSSLHSPEPVECHEQQGVSFESFDASSGHKLITSQRGSGQYTPTTLTPLTPASPANSSNYSASINPASSSYMHLQHEQQNHPHYDYPPAIQRPHTHYHSHHGHHGHHHLRESFKLTNAFKKVRKRARKYTEFLRKK